MTSPSPRNTPRAGRRRRLLIACFLIGLVLGGWGAWHYVVRPMINASSPMTLIRHRRLPPEEMFAHYVETHTWHDGKRTVSVTDTAIQISEGKTKIASFNTDTMYVDRGEDGTIWGSYGIRSRRTRQTRG